MAATEPFVNSVSSTQTYLRQKPWLLYQIP